MTRRHCSPLVLACLVLCIGFAFAADPKDISEYVIPWQRDVVAEAVQSKTINFYFMSGCGMTMEGSDGESDKWGDSCLAVLPDGTTVLIDVGMYQYAGVLKENLHKLGITKIDYLIITHSHNDHAAAVYTEDVTILKDFEVGHCYYNGVYNEGWSDIHLLEKMLDKYGVPYSYLSEGDEFDLGDVHFTVINPPKDIVGETYVMTPDINNSSIVLRMDYGEFSALFTGDIYAAKERELIAKYPDLLDVDFLKVPHHGHDTSSTKEFANAVSPRLAVATGYTLMYEMAYAFYLKTGARVLLDFADGYIHVWSDDQEDMGWESSKVRTTKYYEKYDKALLKSDL